MSNAPALEGAIASERGLERAPHVRRLTAADFPEVYRVELGYVLRTLRRLGVREADLEDVAHEAFVAVVRHLPDYDPERPIRRWLFGFAFRMASDYRKRAHNVNEVPASSPDATETLGPDTALDDARRRALLLQVLDALDFEKRSLIVMHDLDGVPVPEIAETLGVPLNTAYSRLRLARKAFQEELSSRARGGHAGRRTEDHHEG